VGFVVDKVALGQVSSEYFGFPCQTLFITPNSSQSPSPIIRDWYNRPSSGRSTQSPTLQIKKKTQTHSSNLDISHVMSQLTCSDEMSIKAVRTVDDENNPETIHCHQGAGSTVS
jgi:hypothetical protein